MRTENSGMTDYTTLVNGLLSVSKKINGQNSLIKLWAEWFKGFDPQFHQYKIYNGEKDINCNKLSLGMAKKCCEDWASLLLNEKVDAVVSNQKDLDDIFDELDFWNSANKQVEFGMGTSMGGLLLTFDNLGLNSEGSIENTDNIKFYINVFAANRIIPITIKNGKIIEAAFIIENTNETQISVHRLDKNRNYIIDTIIINGIDGSKSVNTFETKSPHIWFGIFYPNLINNIDLDSQLPICVFANAIDTLKAIDNKYDSYNNEFLLGRKRVYISSELNSVSKETGEVHRTFSPNDQTVYYIPANGMNEQPPLIKSDTDNIRAEAHSLALQDELNFFSSKVGLGTNYYKFSKDGRVMTATQVISEKSDTFLNKKRHEKILEKELKDLIKTIMYAYATFKGYKFKDNEDVVLHFDDSIIEDKEAERTRDRTDVQAGIMSKIEYRVKWFNEDENTATAFVNRYFGDIALSNRINVLLPAMTGDVITVSEFVKKVFIDSNEDEQKKIADEIKQKMNMANAITPEDVKAAGFYNPIVN